MTVTQASTKNKKKRPKGSAGRTDDTAVQLTLNEPDAGQRPAMVPPKLAGRVAEIHVRRLRDRADSPEARRVLRTLAGRIARRPTGGRKLAALEMAVGECLDRAAEAAGPRDPWLVREAAVWAVAWLARSGRANGAAGGMLDRLVGDALAAVPLLESRDTLPAAFVLSVARLFSDIGSCRNLERAAAAALREEIGRLVSERGSVALTGSTAVVDRISRWALSREIGEATGGLPWDGATEKRFLASLRTGLRLLGGRARLPSAAGVTREAFATPVIRAARRATGHRRLRRTAKFIASKGSNRRSRDSETKLIKRDHDDPETAVAILRSGFGPDSLRVRVEYRESVPRLEVAVGDRMLFEGPWQWGVVRDGASLSAEGPWVSACLESGRKATFFEITAPLTDGLQIERSVTILARDRVVVLADAIVRRAGDHGSGRLRFRSTVPVAAGLDIETAEETHEAFLQDSAMRCLAMPLALPEWRSAARGRFEKDSDGLRLEQEGHGRLFAPVWLDCDPGRIGGQLTWRQLTVADTRINLPPSMAAGYRVQVGLDQWLLYRALDEARNRTLLGCNVSCEFIVGRVGRSGGVRRAIEIA